MKNTVLEHLKMDKTVIKVSSLHDESDEKDYWLSQSPQSRIEHIEILRQINYGDRANTRLQRVLEIVKCDWS